MRGLLKISRMKTKSRFVGDLLRKAEPSSKVRGFGVGVSEPLPTAKVDPSKSGVGRLVSYYLLVWCGVLRFMRLLMNAGK